MNTAILFYQSFRRAANTMKIRHIFAISFFSVMLTALFFHLTAASAAEARYKNPKIEGYPLDLCRSWARDCGKPAADAYCQLKGYKKALSFSVKNDSPPTRVIGDRRICNEAYCDRISSVVCEVEGVFRDPKVSGYALDLCKKWGAECGKPAADAFCSSRGFKGSVDHAVRKDSPPTRVISSGQMCKEPYCDRIVLVTCKGRIKDKSRGKFDAAGDPMMIPEEGGKGDALGDTIMIPEDEDEFVEFDE